MKIWLLVFLPWWAWAQPADELDAALMQRYQQLQQDETAREQAIRKGRERAVLCKYCHGADGNGGPGNTPTLAGQNPLYLVHQLERFASGQRKRFVMEKLAQNLSHEEMVNLALYYASIAQKPADFDAEKARAGQPLFASHCTVCHGETGMGQKGYARIAGQKPEYVKNTLLNFRKDGEKRFSPEMQAITKTLSETELEQIAHYVASLGQP